MRGAFGLSFGVVLVLPLAGCGGAVIEPGHRGLLFDPANGGLGHEVLAPGYHRVSAGARVDDFDVTYSSRAEPLHVVTSEGLPFDARLTIIYRPIIAELYELDTEIGPRFYDEVIGPEFRSAARAWFAGHSYGELLARNAKVEDDIENEVRHRTAGKHVEIASVTLEGVQLPPELVTAVRDRLLAEVNAQKKKTELESEALQKRLAWESEKIELEHDVERQRLRREAQGGH